MILQQSLVNIRKIQRLSGLDLTEHKTTSEDEDEQRLSVQMGDKTAQTNLCKQSMTSRIRFIDTDLDALTLARLSA